MVTSTRVLSAAVGAMAFGLALAGCSPATGGTAVPTSPAPTDSALASVDLCTILTDDELRSFGLRPDTGRVEEGQGDVGCFWLGTPITLGVTRNLERRSADAFDRAENFLTLRENDIAGRDGRLSQVDEPSCNQEFDAGAGAVLLIVSADRAPNVDPCAEVVRIAELIAPRLPEVGT